MSFKSNLKICQQKSVVHSIEIRSVGIACDIKDTKSTKFLFALISSKVTSKSVKIHRVLENYQTPNKVGNSVNNYRYLHSLNLDHILYVKTEKTRQHKTQD